ncbi:hypothetical protein [Microlunatus sp. GCM10028923]|uniref:hypothetical protein n=1 Tax=Microlunatus sp. GCM10028923 TaxID=3273400 RepID=UPI003612E243
MINTLRTGARCRSRSDGEELHGEPGLDTSDEPFLHHGEELTEARAEQLAQEALANLGRPSLIPDGKSMPDGWQYAPVMRPGESMRDDALPEW